MSSSRATASTLGQFASQSRQRNKSCFSSKVAFLPLQVLIVLGTVLSAGVSLAQPQSVPSVTQAETVSEACIDAANSHDVDQAIATCERAVKFNQTVGNRRLEAYSLGNLGTIYLQQQNYEAAMTFYSQAYQIAQEIGDNALEIKSLIALGTTNLQLEQRQQALDFYQQALTVAQDTGDQSGIAVAFYNLGLTYNMLSQYSSAVDAFQNATTVAQQAGDPLLEGYAANKLKLAKEALTQVGASL